MPTWDSPSVHEEAQPATRQITSWQIAETNAAAWMRYWGYRDARVTSGGPDSGIDVRSSAALAQVKFEAHQVGRPVLQRLVGARGRDHGLELLCFTGTGYSAAAVEYGSEMDIALFTYDLSGAMRPINRSARSMVGRADAARNARSSSVTVTTPVPSRTPDARGGGFLGWFLLAFLCSGTFIAGLTDPETYESAGSFLLSLAALALLGTGVIVGLRKGVRGLRRAMRRDVTLDD
jgi:hypothetical protein